MPLVGAELTVNAVVLQKVGRGFDGARLVDVHNVDQVLLLIKQQAEGEAACRGSSARRRGFEGGALLFDCIGFGSDAIAASASPTHQCGPRRSGQP